MGRRGKRRKHGKRKFKSPSQDFNHPKPSTAASTHESKNNLDIGVLVGLITLCVGALVGSTSPMPEWKVSTLAAAGLLGLLLLIPRLPFRKAPRLTLCGAALCAMLLLAATAWPRITVSPQQITFKGIQANDTYTFRLANETPHDQYQVEVLFKLPRGSLGFDDPELYIPLGSRKPAFDGSVTSDVSVFRCYENDDTPDEYVIFHRLSPGEQREVKLRRKTDSKARVSAEVVFHSSAPASRVERLNTKDDQTQQTTFAFTPIKSCWGANGPEKPAIFPIFVNDDRDWKWEGARPDLKARR